VSVTPVGYIKLKPEVKSAALQKLQRSLSAKFTAQPQARKKK